MSCTLCYTFKNKRVVTKIAVQSLTPHAALCFALLQSGACSESPDEGWPKDYEGLLEVAKQHGLTDIRFHRSLS